jgi:hypothetical protein
MTFIARAAAPTLPGWLVSTRINRVESVKNCSAPQDREPARA